MPLLRKREIKEMTSEESGKKLNEYRTELIRVRTTVESGGTVENPARIRELKRTIARILTEEKKRG